MADSFDQIDNAEGSSLGSHLYECWLKGRHVDVTLKFNLADGSAFLVPAHGRARYRAEGPVELLEVSMPGAGGGGAMATTIF